MFVHWSFDGQLCYFHLLATVNNATMNTGIHVSVWVSAFHSLRYIPVSRIAGLYMIFLCLNFWGTIKLFSTVTMPFYILISNVQVSISLHPHQHLLFSGLLFFLITAILMCMWRVIMVLIYIFLVMSNVEHLFMVLFAIYISSLEESLFKSFVHFQVGLFGLIVVECVSFES